MVSLPDMSQCPNIYNFARIINRYIEDVQVPTKFIIRFRLSSIRDEAENLYQRLV